VLLGEYTTHPKCAWAQRLIQLTHNPYTELGEQYRRAYGVLLVLAHVHAPDPPRPCSPHTGVHHGH